MLEHTRLTLIKNTIDALQSKDPLKIMNAEKVLRAQCHHNKVPLLVFVAEQVMPVFLGLNMDSSVTTIKCSFCNADFNSSQGLNSHLGRVHQDKKHLWSKS